MVYAKKVDIRTGPALMTVNDTPYMAPWPVVEDQMAVTNTMSPSPSHASAVRPRTHMKVKTAVDIPNIQS
ncbi:hypothetical protein TSUKUMMB_50920 [Rhodococcus sp. no. 34]